MTRFRAGTLVVAVAMLIGACQAAGASPSAEPSVQPSSTREPSASSTPLVGHEAAMEAFLGRIMSPTATYQMTRNVLIGSGEGQGDVASIESRYDVSGDDAYGWVVTRGSVVDLVDERRLGPEGNSVWAVTIVDGTTYVWNGSGIEGQSFDTFATPTIAQRPSAIAGLEATDLVFAREIDGLFHFEVVPWILGDPILEWAELGILTTPGAMPMSVESHTTTLAIDADGVPHRLTSSWTTSSGQAGSLTDEYSSMGLYVRILPPNPHAQYQDETSHFVEAGDGPMGFEMWSEVLPDDDDAADLEITFQNGELVAYGMEGSIGFIRSMASSGELLLDTKLDLRGDIVQVPAGEQTIVPYIRSCDGNCGLLDEPEDFCSIEATIGPGGAYELTVELFDYNRAVCSISPSG